MKWAGCLGLVGLAGCTAFPSSPEQGRVEIRKIVDSIECELAAVATSDDADIQSRDIMNWVAATDLDLTLVRSIGADGNVKVGAPAGLAVLSATPKVGIVDTDTRINHIKFANSFQKAKSRYPDNCKGVDPSETRMGLGNAVRFGVVHDVLAAGEGIETMLSLRCALPTLPMVAALSANHLAAMLLGSTLRRLYIARDPDTAGDRAVTVLTHRAERAGIETFALSPRLDDFNEDLRSFGVDELRTALQIQLAPRDVARFLSPAGAIFA